MDAAFALRIHRSTGVTYLRSPVIPFYTLVCHESRASKPISTRSPLKSGRARGTAEASSSRT
jgi:hypothetical protein